MVKEECLICKAPLEYLESDVLMECEICHKKENSKTRCVNGHYVCNDCHTQGLDSIIGLCMEETSRNPIEIIEKMMAMGNGIYYASAGRYQVDQSEELDFPNLVRSCNGSLMAMLLQGISDGRCFQSRPD